MSASQRFFPIVLCQVNDTQEGISLCTLRIQNQSLVNIRARLVYTAN